MNFVKSINVTQLSRVHGARFASWYKSMFKVEQSEPPYSHIVQVGDPVLRKVADPVPVELIKTPEIKFLCDQLERVLKAYKLVGIASPQIGISLRVVMLSFGDELKSKFTPEIYASKEMSTFPQTVFINPEVKVIDHKKVIFEESCASVVGLAAEVPRNYSVKVKALDIEGKEFECTLKGWNARIIQHEVDHCNGILFTDIMDPKHCETPTGKSLTGKTGESKFLTTHRKNNSGNVESEKLNKKK